MSAYDARIEGTDKLKAMSRLLAEIRPKLVVAGRNATEQLAIRYQADVQRRYKSGAHAQLKSSTMSKRRQGKREGRAPAIPPAAGAKPLFRTGKLASSVRRERRVRGTGATFRVFIDPGSMTNEPTPRSLARVAAVHEFGHTISIVADVSVRAYLKALALNVAGTHTRVGGPNKTISITVFIPKRPVWVPAFEELLARAATDFQMMFRAETSKMGLPITITSE